MYNPKCANKSSLNASQHDRQADDELELTPAIKPAKVNTDIYCHTVDATHTVQVKENTRRKFPV